MDSPDILNSSIPRDSSSPKDGGYKGSSTDLTLIPATRRAGVALQVVQRRNHIDLMHCMESQDNLGCERSQEVSIQPPARSKVSSEIRTEKGQPIDILGTLEALPSVV
ncbi:hypothetical protein BTVI_45002 [Pitangus sulphuratus]|nr:hypothetical protein BTVI_45002 [Pitangus sulphuratus]